jgi:hypothetical protein
MSLRAPASKLTAFLTLCLGQVAAAQEPPVSTIEIDTPHGYPVAQVAVNGVRLPLMLDLGGSTPVALTHAAIARAGVSVAQSSDTYRNSGGVISSVQRIVVTELELGGLKLKGVAGNVAMPGGPPDVAGSVGWPVLTRYLLVLDYARQRMRLYAHDNPTAFQAECGDRTFPLAVANGVVTSRAITEYGATTLQWDTGTTSNFMRPAAVPTATHFRHIDDGSPVLTVQHIQLGGTDVGPQDFRLVAFAAPAVDGVLGAGLLATYRVCLDFHRGLGAIR